MELDFCTYKRHLILGIILFVNEFSCNPMKGQVRLVDGGSTSTVVYGRVEIYYSGRYGTICSTHWGQGESDVLCRQLGYPYGTAAKGLVYGQGYGPIWLSSVTCTGTEVTLAACHLTDWGHDITCNREEDVAVVCYRNSPVDGDVRLSGSHFSGRVELYHNGMWGTVTDIDDNTVNVICQQLGYVNGLAETEVAQASTDVPVHASRVRCSGSEVRLTDCLLTWQSTIGQSSDDHSDDAGVVCLQNESPVLRLSGTDGNVNYGRVEVQYNGVYGTVCDTNWDYRDATVVCSMFGHQYGKPIRNAVLGEGSGVIWLNNVHCKGEEQSLTQCRFNRWATGVCDHSQDAGVYCSNDTRIRGQYGYEDIRLSNGSFGYVEIKRNSSWTLEYAWGGICDDGWNDRNADVVCRELGYVSGRAFRESSHGTAEAFWTDAVQCTGLEPSMSYCAHSWWTHDCFPHETASAVCYNTDKASSLDCDFENDSLCSYVNDQSAEIPWSLHSGTTSSYPTSGPTVDHTYENKEGHYVYVEASQNAYKTAQLVSELYTVSSPKCLYFWSHMFGEDTGHLKVSRRSGNGADETILWQRSGPQGNTWKYAEIPLPTGTYKLVFEARIGDGYKSDIALDDITVQTGQCRRTVYSHTRLYSYTRGSDDFAVTVESNGKWRFLCYQGWDYRDAVVACKEMGYQYARPGKTKLTGDLALSIHKDVECRGDETSLTMCSGTFADPFKCPGDLYATVKCESHVVPSVVYLVGSNQPGSGRVEVVYNGVRGTVCDDHFDDHDAHVTCKQMGYQRGKALRGAFFGQGNGSIVLDEMSCYGMEPDISFCASVTGSGIDCDHSEDASVVCYNGSTPIIPGGILCDFENSADRWCGFTQANDDQIDWSVTSGSTPSPDTGPSADVTFGTGTGHYIYIEASGKNTGDKARILSQPISSQFPKCLDFYFNLNGVNAGTLNIYRKDISGSERRLFSVSGNFGDLWYTESVTLESGEYSVVIEAVRGNGNRGDIAVDDVLIYDGQCHNPSSVRLKDGDDTSGRVEVRHLGKWVTICEETFDYRDALVVCRILGHQYGKAVSLKPYGESSSSSWQITNLDCEAGDDDVMQCRPIIARGECPRSQEAAVACLNETSSGIALRLAGGSNDFGRVEVFYNGTWGTICDGYWSDEDAIVVCKQLGFNEGKAYRNAKFGAGSGPIWLSRLRCVGEEPAIDFCANLNFADQSCDHSSDASVACSRDAIQRMSNDIDCDFEYGDKCGYTSEDNGWVYLTGSHIFHTRGLSGPARDHTKGIKEGGYMAAGTKGTLKDEQLLRSAPVVISSISCLQFYYHMFGLSVGSLNVYINLTSNHEVTRVFTATGNQGDLWKLGQVNVTSNSTVIIVFEAVLGEQRKSIIGLDDVSLTDGECPIRAEDGSVRLMPTTMDHYGRVEIYYGGSWGSVCDDGWDNKAALVACRMLGFQNGTAYVGAYFGQGSGSILLDDVKCNGLEWSLSECSHGIWGHTNCDHREDAGVWCYNGSNPPQPLDGEVRLSGSGSDPRAGRVEVYHAGTWGTVCNKGWGIEEANVVCNMLGYSGANATCGGCYGQGSGTIWLTNVHCSGHDIAISQCGHDGWGVHSCDHTLDVGIVCNVKKCSPLLPLPFGMVSPNMCAMMSLPQESMCSTYCKSGYILQGSASHSCLGDGIWSDMTGLECVDGTPPNLTCPPNVHVTPGQGAVVALVTWQHPRASDNMPGTLSISQSLVPPVTLSEGVSHIYVNATDVAANIAKCNFTVNVQVKRCRNLDLSSRENMYVKPGCQTHWGGKCTVGCADGYRLQGNDYVTCEAYNSTSEASWSSINAKCDVVQCADIPGSTEIRITNCYPPYNYGVECHQQCNEGYEWVSGNITRVCTEHGVWSGESIHCEMKRCPPLSTPNNGMLSPAACSSVDGVEANTVCNITCGEGYRLEGPPNMTCLPSGVWSFVDYPTLCAVITAPVLRCPDDISVTADRGNVTATVSWDPPTVIGGNNGTVHFTYSHSNPGDFGEGNNVIVVTGNRSGDVGICTFHIQVKVPRCWLAENTTASGIIYRACQNHYGATCAASCRNGYTSNGTPNRTCDVHNGVPTWREGDFSCQDVEPPTLLSCMPNITVALEIGQQKANVTLPQPIFTDNSGSVHITADKILDSLLEPGIYTVVYTGTDDTGLRASCSVTVSVVDREPPRVYDCHQYIEIVTSTSPSHDIIISGPRFTDNVGIYEETSSGIPTKPVSWGKYNVTYRAIDMSRNEQTCQTQVAVVGAECGEFPNPINGISIFRAEKISKMWRVICNEPFVMLPQFYGYFYKCTQGRWYPRTKPIPCLAKRSYSTMRLTGRFSLTNLKDRCSDVTYEHRLGTAFKTMLLDHGLNTVCSDYICKFDVIISCEPGPEAVFNVDFMSSNGADSDLQGRVNSATRELWGHLMAEITFSLMAAAGQHEITVVTKSSHLQDPHGNCRDGQQFVLDGCVPCPPGTKFDTETRQCVLCPYGTYQNTSENVSCFQCPNNTATIAKGSTEASDCLGFCDCGTYSYSGLEPCTTACLCDSVTDTNHQLEHVSKCDPPCKVSCKKVENPHATTPRPRFPCLITLGDDCLDGVVFGVSAASLLLVVIISVFCLVRHRRHKKQNRTPPFDLPNTNQEDVYEKLRSNFDNPTFDSDGWDKQGDSDFFGRDSDVSASLESNYDEIPANKIDGECAVDDVRRHTAKRQESGAYTHDHPRAKNRENLAFNPNFSRRYVITTPPVAKKHLPVGKKPHTGDTEVQFVSSIAEEPAPDYDDDNDVNDTYLTMTGNGTGSALDSENNDPVHIETATWDGTNKESQNTEHIKDVGAKETETVSNPKAEDDEFDSGALPSRGVTYVGRGRLNAYDVAPPLIDILKK